MKRPGFNSQQIFSTLVAATLSAIIAVGLLAGVATNFQNQGKPFAHLAAAERACAAHAYVSERENCMQEWLAASTSQTVAKK